MLSNFSLALPFALFSCISPGLSQDTPTTGAWQMITLDDTPWNNRVLLTLKPDGSLTISTDCHGYWGPNFGGLRRLPLMMADAYPCPKPDNDADFLPLITAQTTLSLQDDHLTLTAPDGRTATFQRDIRKKSD